jgi:CRISPR-associated protein Csm3
MKGGERMGLEKLEKRQIFAGEITAVTPLHIGSGKPEMEIGEVEMPVLRNTKGEPYIPGSSLKGRVRAEAERIARKLGMQVCNPPAVREMCGSIKNRPEDICTVCKIFGTAGERLAVASKVKFRDAVAVEKVERTEIRAGIAIDRSVGAVQRGALYTVEAVPAGSKFRFEMVAENLTDDELALLLAALASVQDSALGGSSTRGFGKVRIDLHSVRERTPEFYVGRAGETVLEGEALASWLREKARGWA